jgi:hypothetical protein
VLPGLAVYGATVLSRSRAILALAIALAVSLALSLGIAAGQQSSGQQAEESSSGLQVEWAFRPGDLTELVDQSQAAVLADVDAVHAGDPIVEADPGQPGSTISIPTQLIDVTVAQTISGQAPEHLTIYKLGGPGEQPAGDPGYQVGSRYLLFVQPRQQADLPGAQPDNTYIATAPDGRLQELASGELNAAIDGPVADQLDSDTVQQATQEIQVADQGSTP